MNHNFRRAHSAPPSFGHQQPRQPTSPAQQPARNPSEPPNQYVPQIVLVHDPYSFNGPKPYTQRARTGQATRSSPSPTTNNDPRELPTSLTKPSRQNSVQKFSPRSRSMPIEKTDKYAEDLRPLKRPAPTGVTSTGASNTLQTSSSSSSASSSSRFTRQQSLRMTILPPSTQQFSVSFKSTPREKNTDTSHENALTSETSTSTQTHPEVSHDVKIYPNEIELLLSTGATVKISEDIYDTFLKPVIKAGKDFFASVAQQNWSEDWINNKKKCRAAYNYANAKEISDLFKTYSNTIKNIGGRENFLQKINNVFQECCKTLDEKNSTPYHTGNILEITKSLLDKLPKTNFNREKFEAYINFLINEIIKTRQTLQKNLNADQQNIPLAPDLVLLIIGHLNFENFWQQLAKEIRAKKFEEIHASANNNSYLKIYEQIVNSIFDSKAQNKQLNPPLNGINANGINANSGKLIHRSHMTTRIMDYKKTIIDPELRARILTTDASSTPSKPNSLASSTGSTLTPTSQSTLSSLTTTNVPSARPRPPPLPPPPPPPAANPHILAALGNFLKHNSITTNLH